MNEEKPMYKHVIFYDCFLTGIFVRHISDSQITFTTDILKAFQAPAGLACTYRERALKFSHIYSHLGVHKTDLKY